MIKYENNDGINKIMDELDTKIQKERNILNETGTGEKDRMVRSTAAAYIIAYEKCKSLIKNYFINWKENIMEDKVKIVQYEAEVRMLNFSKISVNTPNSKVVGWNAKVI